MIGHQRFIHEIGLSKKKDIFLELNLNLYYSYFYGVVLRVKEDLYISFLDNNSKSDALGIGENIVFNIDSNKSETVKINESLSFLIQKSSIDSVNIGESIQITCFTKKTDEVTISESVIIILLSGNEINGSSINEATI